MASKGASVKVKELALPGTHRAFLKAVMKDDQGTQRVLDVGAGQGALSKLLHELGFEVSACDLNADDFLYDPVECRRVDLNQGLPYDPESFDAAFAVEVAEHVTSTDKLLCDCARVVRPGGIVALSTPNIASLKSRWRYLTTGFYYSFQPNDAQDTSGMQHINPITLDMYRYHGERAGLRLIRVEVDTLQTSSILLLSLWPMLWLAAKLQKRISGIHNSLRLLAGRTLFLVFQKTESAEERL